MTRPLSMLLPVALAAATSLAEAQVRPAMDSVVTAHANVPTQKRAMAGPVRAEPAGVDRALSCTLTGTCHRLDAAPPWQDAAATRGRYVLVGFLVGAGAGWLVYSRACASEDCMGFGGVLLGAAGGLLGMVVGLLLAPAG